MGFSLVCYSKQKKALVAVGTPGNRRSYRDPFRPRTSPFPSRQLRPLGRIKLSRLFVRCQQTVDKPAFAASEDSFWEKGIRKFLKLLTAKFASPMEMIQNGVFQRPVNG